MNFIQDRMNLGYSTFAHLVFYEDMMEIDKSSLDEYAELHLQEGSHSYVDYSNQKDIAVYYILRNDDFHFMLESIEKYITDKKIDVDAYISKQDIKDNIVSRFVDRLKEEYSFNLFDYLAITNDLYYEDNLLRYSDLVKYFTFKPNQSIKLKLDAEKTRLIVYDVFAYIKLIKLGKAGYPSTHSSNEEQDKKVNQKIIELAKDKKMLLEFLAQKLFPNSTMVNGVNQIQKALREAEERISHEGWRKYIITKE